MGNQRHEYHIIQYKMRIFRHIEELDWNHTSLWIVKQEIQGLQVWDYSYDTNHVVNITIEYFINDLLISLIHIRQNMISLRIHQ